MASDRPDLRASILDGAGLEPIKPSVAGTKANRNKFVARGLIERIARENGGPELKAKPGSPAVVPVFTVQTEPDLFQVRASKEPVERQVIHLMKMLKIYPDLDPIHALWTGKRAVVIEGHHRRAAYWRERGERALIPVRWYEGDINGAVAAAMSENGKQAEPITSRDRQNFAWMLVKLRTFTKPQICKMAGVSNGQVGLMRKALAILTDYYDKAAGIVRWQQALEESGLSQRMEHTQDALSGLADAIADDMLRKLKPGLANNPKLLAAALWTFCGRKAGEVAHELAAISENGGPDWDTDSEPDDDLLENEPD